MGLFSSLGPDKHIHHLFSYIFRISFSLCADLMRKKGIFFCGGAFCDDVYAYFLISIALNLGIDIYETCA